MKHENLAPLDDKMIALLVDEKNAPNVSDTLQRQIHERLHASIAAAPLIGNLDISESLEPASDLVTTSSFLLKPLILGPLALFLGAGAGIVGTLAVTAQEEKVPTTVPAQIQPASQLDAGLSIALIPDASLITLPNDAQAKRIPAVISTKASPNKVTGPSRGPKDNKLAAERALLEQARTAIRLGNSAAALRLLKQHQEDHPKGRMSEERDALRVQALFKEKAFVQAKKRAEKFQQRYPHSLFLPIIDHVLSESP